MTSEVSASASGSGGGSMNAYNGSSLEIVTLVLVAVSCFVVLVRGVARYRISRVAEPSDILLPLALVVAIAQSVCVRLSLSSGLGRHADSLSPDQVTQFQKLTYASNLLFQLVLSLSQLIVVLLIKSVEPQRPVRIGCNVLLGCIGIYSTLSLAILALQCSLPQPWLVGTDRCVDRQTFLTSFIIVSIVIDAATLVLPIIMVCRLKTPRDKKIFVCVLFGTRIALPLVTAPQISRLKTVLVSQDPTWDLVSFQMWVQIVMNISVITACLPSLGRMMWQLMTSGSAGLKSTWSTRDSESRDFGHELGLENGKLGYLGMEKPYIQQPSPAFSPMGEKGSWSDQVIVQVRSIGSHESFDSNRSSGSLEPLVTHHDTARPTMPPRTASLSYLPRRPNHHYRRPFSKLLSPVLERSPALGAQLPPITTAPAHHRWRGAYDAPPAYSQPQFQPQFQSQYQPQSQYQSQLQPQLQPQPLSPTIPWDASSSLYDEDLSEIDIDSYYLGNTQMSQLYNPSLSELVLESMIEDLQRENAASRPSPRLEGGWI
ncbi:hypothetical protein A1O3_05658 [Capronia epimyces CBS 606.96]|uniref:Rhodopsin domain-containing protein n=1 Tax=Capronia epimyces CBS 606.96 TaxID=1182542 RepID=W9XXN4_9EURO|nr:uncharacterized protein A1O3_05658 [Capronia epimyces CBS 606.96]EXJ84983.1 hypothetical protein A1O3_05658 [Capronia epimyces CBS 606.96]